MSGVEGAVLVISILMGFFCIPRTAFLAALFFLVNAVGWIKLGTPDQSGWDFVALLLFFTAAFAAFLGELGSVRKQTQFSIDTLSRLFR
ncbi:MAG: hypothetical protein AAB601_02200 [Patescibacteria group bacterium]